MTTPSWPLLVTHCPPSTLYTWKLFVQSSPGLMGTGHREEMQLWAVAMAEQSNSQARADLNQLLQTLPLQPQLYTTNRDAEESDFFLGAINKK